MAKKIISAENQLTRQDIERSLRNVLIFASPLLILALTELQAGKSFADIADLLGVALIQLLIDLLRKFRNETTY